MKNILGKKLLYLFLGSIIALTSAGNAPLYGQSMTGGNQQSGSKSTAGAIEAAEQNKIDLVLPESPHALHATAPEKTKEGAPAKNKINANEKAHQEIKDMLTTLGNKIEKLEQSIVSLDAFTRQLSSGMQPTEMDPVAADTENEGVAIESEIHEIEGDEHV